MTKKKKIPKKRLVRRKLAEVVVASGVIYGVYDEEYVVHGKDGYEVVIKKVYGPRIYTSAVRLPCQGVKIDKDLAFRPDLHSVATAYQVLRLALEDAIDAYGKNQKLEQFQL
jgi:hypothetical protein